MAKNHNNSSNFQLQPNAPRQKNLYDVISEIIANVKVAITLVIYLVLITIMLGLGYVILRITVWAASVVIHAIGL